MSNLFSKHLRLCFFNSKYPTIPLSEQHNQHHTRSPSPSSSPSPSNPNSTMFRFNTTFIHHDSLYDATSSADHSTPKSTDDYFSSSSDSEAADFPPLPPPDFAAVFASQRFFFSSPGPSNSIIESPDTRLCNSRTTATTFDGGVRVPKYSLNPYMDFLCSMKEMIDSREFVDVRKDWDYLHELLLCYLALNPTHTHKYIVRAFTDLVVELLSSTSSSSSSPQPQPPLSMVKNSHPRKSKN